MFRKLAILVTAFAILVSAIPAEAQQSSKVHRIGYLSAGSAKAFKDWVDSFRQGLRELGYVEGKNIVIAERYAAGRRKRLPELAAELVRLGVDVIVAHCGALDADRAAKKAGRTIPIVFAVSADPIGAGYVASLARPGGNITGLSDAHSDLVPKRLQLLKQVVPSASRVAVLFDPTSPTARQLKALQTAAPSLDMTILPFGVKVPGDFDRTIAAMRTERPGALVIIGTTIMASNLGRVAEFALKNRLPAIFTIVKFPKVGGLMSYGTNFNHIYRRAAHYVDKILRGAKPADLPVEQPTKFDFVLNLKTAKALGITFPPSILLRATKVIE